jgi:hypothetical protein
MNRYWLDVLFWKITIKRAIDPCLPRLEIRFEIHVLRRHPAIVAALCERRIIISTDGHRPPLQKQKNRLSFPKVGGLNEVKSNSEFKGNGTFAAVLEWGRKERAATQTVMAPVSSSWCARRER